MSTEKSDETHSGDAVATAQAVISRLKEATNCRSDASLAELLGTTRSNVAKWRKRNSVPYAEAMMIARDTGMSLDYILMGIENDDIRNVARNIDADILAMLIASILHKADVDTGMKNEDREQIAKGAADIIARKYNVVQFLMDKLISETSLPRSKVKDVAIMAAKSIIEADLDGDVLKSDEG